MEFTKLVLKTTRYSGNHTSFCKFFEKYEEIFLKSCFSGTSGNSGGDGGGGLNSIPGGHRGLKNGQGTQGTGSPGSP